MQQSPRIVIFHKSPGICEVIRQNFSFIPMHFETLSQFSEKGLFNPLDIYILPPQEKIPYLKFSQSPDCIPDLLNNTLIYSDQPLSHEEKIIYYEQGYFCVADSDASMAVFCKKISWLLGQKYRAVSQQIIANRLNLEFQSLKEDIQGKNELLHMAVHDLRSPLSAMICYSEILMDGILDSIREKGINPLNVIHQNCQFLIDMVNDLLDLAQHEAGKKRLRLLRTNLINIIKKVVRSLDGLARTKRIDIGVTLQKVPDIFADTQKMERVVINLLSNAIKFTKAGGAISIRTFQKGNHIVLAIRDTGPGIKESDIQKIFDKFNIGDDSSISGKGHGLGLAITKSFVEMHGGRIYVKSERHKGSTFIIHLPIEKRLESVPKPVERRVAVFDLGKDLGQLQQLSDRHTLDVDYSSDENKVMEKVLRGNYSCLIINEKCHYESLNLKVFADILEGRLRYMPVLCLVPSQMSEDEIELYRYLDIYVIQKPVSLDKLSDQINEALERDRRKTGNHLLD